MLAQVTMLFSSSRRTVCTPCLPFLRKIEISPLPDFLNPKIIIFDKMVGSQPWEIEISQNFIQHSPAYAQYVQKYLAIFNN